MSAIALRHDEVDGTLCVSRHALVTFVSLDGWDATGTVSMEYFGVTLDVDLSICGRGWISGWTTTTHRFPTFALRFGPLPPTEGTDPDQDQGAVVSVTVAAIGD